MDVVDIYQRIKRKLQNKFFTIEDSPINRVTLNQWEKRGLPKSVKNFFYLCELCEIDPCETYEKMLKAEKEHTTKSI